MSLNSVELFILFFLIAAVYASAGFGGGSSYIAVLVLWGIEMTTLRSVALLCNLVVTAASCYWFWRSGYLSKAFLWRILPLCAASIPMAFVGGWLPIKTPTFMFLLGFSLMLSAILMFLQSFLMRTEKPDSPKNGQQPAISRVFENTVLGGAIGLLSGIVGIGGGIFLSPYLHLRRWDAAKNIAATTAFFIFVNSLSGLFGQWAKQGHLSFTFALPLVIAVFMGGQVGVRVALLRFSPTVLRIVTAGLILYAGVNILLK